MSDPERAKRIVRGAGEINAQKAAEEEQVQAHLQQQQDQEKIRQAELKAAKEEQIRKDFETTGVVDLFESLVKVGAAMRVDYNYGDRYNPPKVMLVVYVETGYVSDGGMGANPYCSPGGLVATLVPFSTDFWGKCVEFKRVVCGLVGKNDEIGIYVNGRLVGRDGTLDDLMAKALSAPKEWDSEEGNERDTSWGP